MKDKKNLILQIFICLLFIIYCFFPIYGTIGEDLPTQKYFFSIDILIIIPLIVSIMIFKMKKIKLTKISIFVWLYTLITLIISIFNHFYIINVLYSVAPILVYYLIDKYVFIEEKILKIIYYILNLSILLSLLSFFIGDIGQIFMTFNNGLIIEKATTQLSWWGEYRISWVYYHKIIVATICNLLIVFNLAEIYYSKLKINLIIRCMFLLCSILGVIMSSSKTSILGMVIIIAINLIVYLIKTNKVKKGIKIFIFTSSTIIFTPFILKFLINFYATRDIKSGGLRFIIWEYVLNNIFNHPFGFGYIPSYLDYGTSVLGFQVGSTHNTFLMYGIKENIFTMILFIFIFISMIYFSLSKKNYFLFLSAIITLLGFMTDMFNDSYIIMIFLYLVVFSKYIDFINEKNSNKERDVLICIDSLGKGGAEKSVVEVINLLVENKFKVDLLCLNSNDSYYLQYISPKVNIIRTPFNLKNNLCLRLYRAVLKFSSSTLLYKFFIGSKSINYKYEIAFLEGASAKIISGSNKNSVKLCWIHCNVEEFLWYSSFYRNFLEEKRCFEKFDNIITVSNELKDIFIKKYSINNLQVIYNFIDYTSINDLSLEDIKISFSPYICCVGRLHPIKGLERLINEYYNIHKNIETLKFNLLIIGEGEEKENLKLLVEKFNLNEFIKFIDFTPNPYKYILNSIALYSGSYSEGLPMIFLEAMALNKKIITVNHSGAKEIINNENGIIFENCAEGVHESLLYINNNLIDLINNDYRFNFQKFNNNNKQQLLNVFNN